MAKADNLILMEKAPVGLHDAVEPIVTQYVARDARIVDVACGTGAMCRRLSALGYGDVNANDIDEASFEAKEINFTSFDLNEQFSQRLGQGMYDCVIAIETIEHLENPLAFIRECKLLLKENGYLLITTPNVLGSESAMQLLKCRELLYFSKDKYDEFGHISILPDFLLDAHLEHCGLTLLQRGYSPRLLTRAAGVGVRNIVGSIILKTFDVLSTLLGRSTEPTQGTNYIVLALNAP